MYWQCTPPVSSCHLGSQKTLSIYVKTLYWAKLDLISQREQRKIERRSSFYTYQLLLAINDAHEVPPVPVRVRPYKQLISTKAHNVSAFILRIRLSE